MPCQRQAKVSFDSPGSRSTYRGLKGYLRWLLPCGRTETRGHAPVMDSGTKAVLGYLWAGPLRSRLTYTCEEIHDLHGVSRSRSRSEPRSKSESKSKVESRSRSRSRLRGDSPSISQVCHLDWVTVRELRRACRLRHRETLYRHAISTVRTWVVSPLSYKVEAHPCYETSAQNLDRPVSTRYTYQPFRKIDSSLRERPPSFPGEFGP